MSDSPVQPHVSGSFAPGRRSLKDAPGRLMFAISGHLADELRELVARTISPARGTAERVAIGMLEDGSGDIFDVELLAPLARAAGLPWDELFPELAPAPSPSIRETAEIAARAAEAAGCGTPKEAAALGVLIGVLIDRERDYEAALEEMRTLPLANDEQFFGHRRALREAVELARVARRLLWGRVGVREVHAAFGAPGDWGYETEIGRALATIYGTPGGDE